MKGEDKPFFVYHSDKVRQTARTFSERLGTDGIRAQKREMVDGREAQYRSKAGNPELKITEEEATAPAKVIKYRGFVTKPTWFYTNEDIPFYTYPEISLNHYGGDPAAWYIKTNKYKYGASTGYCVGTKRQPVFSTIVPDESFYDVIYLSGAKLYVNGKAIKLDVSLAATVPYIFPTVSEYQYIINDVESDADGRNFHLFTASATQVRHQRGDEATTSSHTLNIEPYLPITATPLASSFGINPNTDKVNLFGVWMIPSGQSIGNIYFFGQEVQLSRYAPYITPDDVVINMVPMSVSNDLSIGKSFDSGTGTPSLPQGFATSLPMLDVVEYEMSVLKEYPDRSPPTAEIGGGVTHIARDECPVVPAETSVATWDTMNNSMFETRTIPVLTQTGWVDMVQNFSSSTTYRHDYCDGDANTIYAGGRSGSYFYDGNGCVVGTQYAWPYPYSEGQTVGMILTGVGSWLENRYSSNGASQITHMLGDIEMFYYNATVSYQDEEYAYNHNYNHVQDLSPVLSSYQTRIVQKLTCIGSQGPMYGVFPMSFSYNATSEVRYGNKPLNKAATESSSARCRDYIYHDKINAVAIYIKTVCSGTESSSSATISLVVEARGIEREITLFTNSSGNRQGVAASRTWVSVNGYAYWPDFLHSPSVYSPICEQGDFPYIAYTTAAEESAGVPRRFTLSIPLFIKRHNMTLIEPPEPPSACYAFTAYNLTNVIRLASSGVWDKLESTVFHIHVSHDGERDWLVDLQSKENGVFVRHVKGDSEHHFAECYRV